MCNDWVCIAERKCENWLLIIWFKKHDADHYKSNFSSLVIFLTCLSKFYSDILGEMKQDILAVQKEHSDFKPGLAIVQVL